MVRISVKRLSRSQSHSAAERIKSMNNPNDNNGNRTRVVPVFSAVHYGIICSYSLHSNIYIRTIVFERNWI